MFDNHNRLKSLLLQGIGLIKRVFVQDKYPAHVNHGSLRRYYLHTGRRDKDTITNG